MKKGLNPWYSGIDWFLLANFELSLARVLILGLVELIGSD